MMARRWAYKNLKRFFKTQKNWEENGFGEDFSEKHINTLENKKPDFETVPKLSDFKTLPKVALVRFVEDIDMSGYQHSYPELKVTSSSVPERKFLFLGEILQCPGHVVIQGFYSGKIFTMIHTDDLEMIPFEEV
jgi:hypothetical protein